MENIKQNELFQVLIAIGIIFTAFGGLISFIKYLEEREINRKSVKKTQL